jgi:PAS domain S-box-containing protein
MKISSKTPAAVVTLTYIVIGAVWILLADVIIPILFSGRASFSVSQILKDALFITLTAILLYVVVKKLPASWQTGSNKKRLPNAKELYQVLVEKLPAVVFMDIFNEPFSSLYISPKIKDLLGYTAEEWAAEENLWEQLLHPDDRERVLAADVSTDQTREPFRIEYRIRHRDGHYVWIKEDADLVTSAEGTPQFWHGILVDITEQKKAEEGVLRRDAILKAVGFAAEQFLKSINWEESIGQSLEMLGEATKVSRVYIFKKVMAWGNEVMISHAFEWCQEGIAPQIQNPDLQNIRLRDANFGRWIDLFDQGQHLVGNVSEFPDIERPLLETQGIKSLICIPIQATDDWWGFIGFDDCASERVWSETEVEALRAAADTLGAAIKRRQSEEALRNSENSYKGLFNAVQDAIYIQNKDGVFLDVNQGAALMYGYPREYFIGKTPRDLGVDELNDPNKLFQAIELAFTGQPQEFDFWGRHSNGEIFPQEVRLFRGAYFGEDVVIAVTKDITTRKQSEEALQRQLRELSVLHAAALAGSIAKDTDTLIQQITNIISDTLYSDNCGVFLLNEAQDMLYAHFSYRGVDTGSIGGKIPTTQGISGKVIATRQAVCIGDVSQEPSYFEISPATQSELCVPISGRNRLFGVLNVESKKKNAFSERDEKLLLTVAGNLANAMERIQLYELEKKRREQAEIMREATLELTSFFNLDQVFESVFSSLAKLIRFDSASIEVIKGGQAQIVVGKNLPKNVVGRIYPYDERKWGNMRKNRHPIIIPDTWEDDRFIQLEETSQIRGWMGIPLLAHDDTIGFLNLDSFTIGYFTPEHASMAQTIANQAAIAIENARLFELAQTRREEAETLRLATASLANTLDMDSLLENILDWLNKLAPYDSASIMLKQGDMLKLAAVRNLPKSFEPGNEFPITRKWQKIYEDRKPLIIYDVHNDPLFEKWDGTEYIRGWMSVAMFVQDTLIGFLNMDSKTVGAFTSEHEILVQTFSNQAATAIEKARLFELEKRRRETSDVVRQAATALTNLLDISSLNDAILDWLHKITPYDSASIMEIEGEWVRVTASKGLPHMDQAQQQVFPLQNPLCQIINATGSTLIVDDCWNDPRFEKWDGAEHTRGWMGVPLTSKGQVIGYITVDSKTPNAFTQYEANAAQTFAQQAATSLENVRLYTETRQRLEELEIISRVSQALRAARGVNEMIPILLEELIKSVGTDTVAISLYDHEAGILTPHAASGWLQDTPKSTFKPGEGIIGHVFQSGKMHVSPEFIEDPLAYAEGAKFIGPGWGGIAVPISTSNEVIGVIIVAQEKPKKIEAHQTRLINTIAEIAGNAIHRSTLYERSEEQVRRLITLREMDTAITSSLDLRITLNIITEHLITKMGADAAAILVFNPESQMLDSYAANGFESRESTRRSLSIGNSLAGKILLNRRSLFIRNLSAEEDTQLESLHTSENFVSYYAIPLFSKGVTKGILETYFRTPFSPTADWTEFLQTLAGQASIAIDNSQLFESLQHTNQEISLAYDTTLEGWGKALELRDKETQGHTRRVTNLTLELARQMGIRESELIHFRRGALLHDIGKMGVPDSILRKAGPLTVEEMTEMKRHPQYAYDLLYPINYLRPALDIPYCHHEWWDGNGYPRGLAGEEIPLAARIFAIVDVWDALLSDRPYRKAWDEKDVMNYINGLINKQFDPAVVAAFQNMISTDHSFMLDNYPPVSNGDSNNKN